MHQHATFLPGSLAALCLAASGACASPATELHDWHDSPHKREPVGATADQLVSVDRLFIRNASASLRFGIEASRLAVERAANPTVRAFAATVAHDFGNSSAGLQRLALPRGVTPPLMPVSHRKTLNRLAKAHGAGFDRIYIRDAVVGAYRVDIRMLERAQAEVRDPDLKDWIADTLPLMRAHQARAERLAAGGRKLK